MKKQTFSGFLIGLTLLTSACSILDRSPESGYSSGNSRNRSSVKHRSSQTSTPMRAGQEEPEFSQKTRLKQLENSLSTKKETEQYSKALPWFQSDDERIQFLALPGFEARQKWLREQNFSSRSGSAQNDMKELVEAQDIAIGMAQSLVKKSWGEPESVDVSGNPQFKNERWHYSKFVSTPDGYKPEKKIVFFEAGKVVGWEVE